MAKQKRKISILTVVTVFFAMLCLCPTVYAENRSVAENNEGVASNEKIENSASATLAYTEQYTDTTISATSAAVMAAPVWTADTLDTLSSGKAIKILYREYGYYYIQYQDSNNKARRGYILRTAASTSVSRWCQYDVYNPGYNKSGVSQVVYHCPEAGSQKIGTIYADEGTTPNNTLIVLCEKGNYYLIQYITNTSNTGSQHIKWKRGWVLKSTITVNNPTSIYNLNSETKFYIQNVGTGRYLDIKGYSTAPETDIHIWDFHGGDNQEWTLTPRTDSTGARYVTISTSQASTAANGMVLSVRDALSVINTQIEITEKGSTPSKDQEFYIEYSEYEDEYYIYSRLTGNYLQLGIYSDQTGNGGPVLNKYPYVTQYNRWRLIPVYKVNEDYKYTSNGKIPSDVDYGINAKYNISSVRQIDTSGIYDVNFEALVNQAFAAWTDSNARIMLSSGGSTGNNIIFSEERRNVDGQLINGHTVVNSSIVNGFVTKDVYIYYPNIADEARRENEDVSQVWLSTLVHELGHTLGLGDWGNLYQIPEETRAENPNLYQSIMVYRSRSSEVLTPHEAEFAGVKKAYHAQH